MFKLVLALVVSLSGRFILSVKCEVSSAPDLIHLLTTENWQTMEELREVASRIHSSGTATSEADLLARLISNLKNPDQYCAEENVFQLRYITTSLFERHPLPMGQDQRLRLTLEGYATRVAWYCLGVYGQNLKDEFSKQASVDQYKLLEKLGRFCASEKMAPDSLGCVDFSKKLHDEVMHFKVKFYPLFRDLFVIGQADEDKLEEDSSKPSRVVINEGVLGQLHKVESNIWADLLKKCRSFHDEEKLIALILVNIAQIGSIISNIDPPSKAVTHEAFAWISRTRTCSWLNERNLMAFPPGF